jgi:hypothetical protein
VSHVFSKVVDELRDKNFLTDEDLENLQGLVYLLQQPYVDLKDDLENHPQHQLTASYYASLFKRLKEDAKEAAERHWYGLKSFMSGQTDKRVTDTSVTAACKVDPTYTGLKNQEALCSYFHDQLTELRVAYVTRARMLEQVSNNSRAQLRDDQEDELS